MAVISHIHLNTRADVGFVDLPEFGEDLLGGEGTVGDRVDQEGLEGQQRLDLQLSLDLGALIPPEAAVEISAAAVLESVGHGCSYWAWRHTGPVPDFHRRDSFLSAYC